MTASQQGSTHETVRRRNLSVLLRSLHLDGAQTRSDLAARTELNRSTIKVLVEQLAGLGLAGETAPDPSGTRGRPSPRVNVRTDDVAVLAVEIAVDSVAVGVVALGGHVHGLRRAALPGGATEPGDALAVAATLAADVMPDRPKIVGAGVAVAGLVRREDGHVVVAPNLGWTDVPLAELVSAWVVEPSCARRVPVAVANEADLGALAEHAHGAARGADDVVFVSGEVGLGGGVIAGGRWLTGARGHAGEVGHLPVNPAGRVCGCGGRGCWETEAGSRALLRRAGIGDRQVRLATQDGQDQPATVDDVLVAARAGDGNALQAVHEVARWLAVGLTGLVNIVDPELVVLGGTYARAFDLMAPVIRDELDSRAIVAARAAELTAAALGPDAAVLGAAELALAPVLDRPDDVAGGAERRKTDDARDAHDTHYA